MKKSAVILVVVLTGIVLFAGCGANTIAVSSGTELTPSEYREEIKSDLESFHSGDPEGAARLDELGALGTSFEINGQVTVDGYDGWVKTMLDLSDEKLVEYANMSIKARKLEGGEPMDWKNWADDVKPGDLIVYHPGDGSTEERTVWAVSKKGDDPPRFKLDTEEEVSYRKCIPISLSRQISQGL